MSVAGERGQLQARNYRTRSCLPWGGSVAALRFPVIKGLQGRCRRAAAQSEGLCGTGGGGGLRTSSDTLSPCLLFCPPSAAQAGQS